VRAADLTLGRAQAAWVRAVADRCVAVRASGVRAVARLSAITMLDPHIIIFLNPALEARLQAGMSAWQGSPARRRAMVNAAVDVKMAWYLHLVPAPQFCLLNFDVAENLRLILVLVARQRSLGMPTSQLDIDVHCLETDSIALITTRLRAVVRTAILRPGARLQTMYSIVQEVRVALADV